MRFMGAKLTPFEIISKFLTIKITQMDLFIIILNKMSVLDRFKEVIKYSGLNKSNFAKKINTPTSTINNILSRNSKPNVDILNEVINSFGDINAEWLLTGKGQMLKPDDKTIIQGNNENNIVNSNISTAENVNELIKMFQQQLAIKDKQIEKLIDKIGK